MYIIIYNNQTKYIANARYDGATNCEKPTPEWWLQNHVKMNKLNATQFSVATIPFVEEIEFVIGRDKFDESDNTIYADPDWVAPVPTPAPTE